MGEIHLDFLNLNSLFLILLIILIGGYLYYEIHKLKGVINEIQYQLNQRDRVMIHEGIPQMNNHDEAIEREQPVEIIEESQQYGKDEWSEIHQQMNRNVDDASDSVSSSGSSGSSRSSRSLDLPDGPNSSDLPNDILDTLTPENNRANIDEILVGKSIITDNSLSDILNVDSDLTKIDEFINVIKGSELTKLTKTATTDYEKMTVSQLKKILSDKDLPVSGNKTKLIERIKENNEV